MTSRDLCFWLQGFFELSGCEEGLKGDQVRTIRNHLALVFQHEIDPSYSDDPKVQADLQATHDGEIKLPFPPQSYTGGKSSDTLYRC